MGVYLRYSAVASRLGISTTMFYSRRSAMEAEGFPKPDPIFRRYHGDDVEAWIKARRKVADSDNLAASVEDAEINFSAL
ncbi:helix-turn-helix transcriptional regulator [Paracoccus aminophilus]|uniref:helix-turn-helix transcriptional regulator n=1 Tax=Paracoccus aminophilus TaxID=34003 RepID=UPI00059F20BA|nr:hypothetical protein [Paracoccus aminophilus]